jgi:hypothetical protein
VGCQAGQQGTPSLKLQLSMTRPLQLHHPATLTL